MKHILTALFTFLSLAAGAQTIECTKVGTEVQAGIIGANAMVRFVSADDRWVIKPVVKKNVKDGEMKHSVVAGRHCYDFLVDVMNDRERTYIISKEGSPLSEQVVTKNLRRGTCVTYNIQEIADTLDRIELQENGSRGVYPKDGYACVEITTAIEGLKVGTAWAMTEKKTASGVRAVEVIVNVSEMKAVKAQIDSLAAVVADMEAKGDYINMEGVLKQQEEKEKWYASHTSIELGGEGIKALSLPLTDISQKERLRYAVVAMKMSECLSLMDEAATLFKNMKYGEAKKVYTSALQSKDVTPSLAGTINASIARCDSCVSYFQRLVGVLTLIKQRKEASDKVSQYDVASYYNAAIEYMQILYRYNPVDYYKNNIAALEKVVGDMPFLMRFTVVSWMADRVSAGEGGPMQDVEVWGWYGDKASLPRKYEDNKSFRSQMKKNNAQYKHLGLTDANGVLDLELRRSTLPKGFFFAPVNVDVNTDVVYRDMEEVMSQAKTEYNKRQFRLKMYIKE